MMRLVTSPRALHRCLPRVGDAAPALRAPPPPCRECVRDQGVGWRERATRRPAASLTLLVWSLLGARSGPGGLDHPDPPVMPDSSSPLWFRIVVVLSALSALLTSATRIGRPRHCVFTPVESWAWSAPARGGCFSAALPRRAEQFSHDASGDCVVAPCLQHEERPHRVPDLGKRVTV